jgi:hypothetical protein
MILPQDIGAWTISRRRIDGSIQDGAYRGAAAPSIGRGWCPDCEARMSSQHVRMRISE